MKKAFYLFLVVFAVALSTTAQNLSDNPFNASENMPEQGQSEDIWGQKKSNPFDNNGTSLKRPRTGETVVVDTPIDGGVLILLGAGALYGSKRLRRSRSKAAA